MKQFVAVSDDVLYRQDGPPGPLVPYHCGVFCWHQLREELAHALPADRVQTAAASRGGEGAGLSA